MAVTVEELRRARADRLAQMRRENNPLLNYVEYTPLTVNKEKEGAKASSAGVMERVLATGADGLTKVREGLFKGLEGIVDLGAGLVGAVGGLFSKDFRDDVQGFIATDWVGDWYDSDIYKWEQEHSYIEEGGLADEILQGVGGMLPAVAINMALPGAGIFVMGAQAVGNSTESAYHDGADFYQGLGYGILSGGVELLTEKFVGGGLENLTGAGWFDELIPLPKTGVGRYAANAVGEGLEEVAAELVNPLAKTIYKGRDALDEYGTGEYWKGVGKAGLTGAAVSGIYGGAFDVMAGGVKAGDINAARSEIDAIRTRSENQKVRNKFTPEKAKQADSQTLGNLKIIEKTLKSVDEGKRAELIKKNGLSGIFSADGSLDAYIEKSLTNGSGFDRRYYSENQRGLEKNIDEDIKWVNMDLRARRDNLADELYNGDVKYSFVGTKKDGTREYKSDFDESVPQEERVKQFRSRIASVFNLGMVELKTDTKKLQIRGDDFTAQKNLYGDSNASPEEQNAKTNALYDMADILQTAKYMPNKTAMEPSYQNPAIAPKNKAHNGVKYWYKFQNDIIFDGVPYTVTFNIRDKGKEQYQYLISFDEKNAGRLHQPYSLKQPPANMNNRPTLNSIAQNSEMSIENQENIDENLWEDNVWEVGVFDGELSEKAQARYSKAQKVISIFSSRSYSKIGLIVINGNSGTNGFISLDGRRIYISADNFESGAWAGTIVHEVMHFAEGTEEYNRLVKLLESDTELDGEAVNKVFKKSGYGFDKAAMLDIERRLMNGGVVTEEERRAYQVYREEVSAHASEMILGTESFIDKVIRTDASLAEKIIGKIKDLKEAFGRIGDSEAQAQHKRLVEAEKLYLKAIEAAGKKFENGKIVSAGDKEDEKENTVQGGGKYDLKDIEAPTYEELVKKDPIRVIDISEPQTQGTFKERRKSIVENAEELIKRPYLNKDTDTLIFLSNSSYTHTFNNLGDFQLNMAEQLPKIIENAIFTHKEPATHGNSHVSGVYTFFAAVKDANFTYPVKLKVKEHIYSGQELPKNIKEYFENNPEDYYATYDAKVLEVEEIEESPSGSANKAHQDAYFLDPNGLPMISIADLLELVKGDAEKYIPRKMEKAQFSFKEDSTNNEKVGERVENAVNDNKKANSYTKAEAEAMVDGIMGSLFSFDGYHGELKSKTDAIKQAHAMLNGAESGKRFGAALKFADYIIQHAVLTDDFNYDTMIPHIERIEILKPYLHKLNLDNIKGEIDHHYDKGRKPYALWGKRKGERGLGIDVMAMELKEQGYILKSENIADVLFEVDRDYRASIEALKDNAKTAVNESYSAEELKSLRNSIAKQIMQSFDERDFSLPKLRQIAESRSREAERLREANIKLRKEAYKATKTAERAIAEKNEAKEKTRKADEARRESEGFSKVANRVLKLVRDINNWKKGVFESAAEANGDVFKGIIGELSRIDVKGNVSPISARKAMKKLADWYGAADIYPIVNELKEANLWSDDALSIMAAIGDPKSIEARKPLSVTELKNLEVVIRHLKNITEIYHRAFRAGKYVDAKPLAEDYLRIIGENAKVNVGRVAKLIDSGYYEYFGDPESLMKWHDRYDKNGFFTATFNELREGALNMAIAQMEMRAELDGWLDENPDFLKKLNNTKIEVEGIEMSRAEALSLYMTARREQARGGLAVGGFEVKDAKSGEKTGVDGLVDMEMASAETSGDVTYDMEKMIGLVVKFKEHLFEQFNDSEKKYLSIVEKILNEDCKVRKERTDNRRLGYSNTLEGFYYPIRRGHIAYKVGEDTLGAELGRIRKLSFNQDTVKGAKGRLFIEPINNVVDRHIAGIAMYENISIAIDNFNLLFNMDISGNKNNPVSIAKAMEKEGGWAEGGKYIDKLIKDIEGINTADKYEAKALAFIRSGFAKFQLGANPKTWVTQLSSLFAASSMLDPKYMAQAMVSKTSAKAFGAELDKYSPLAKLRNSENTSALAEGVMDKISGFGDVLMKPIGMTDRFVIKKLWYACQLQVAAEQKLELGSNDNKVAAAKLLEKVIFETQQNSLLTERSAAMRSNSELIKGLTMFSSDAMKVTARIVDAYGKICVIKDKLKTAEGEVKKGLEADLKKAVKEFRRASASAISTAVFMSVIALVFSNLYGKRDDDETLAETAKDFGFDFAGNLLGGLPLIRDIYSYFADGYEMNHYALSSVNDLISGVNGLITLAGAWVGGKQITSQEIAGKTKAALFGAGQLFGIPLRNAYNVGRGVFGLTGLITGNGKSFGYSWDSVFYDKNYRSDLNKAIEAGDDKLVETISSLIVGESFGGVDNAVADELRRLVATGADVLPRAVGDSITYDGEKYRFTLRQRSRFEDIYGTADEVLVDLVKLKQYKTADDATKAKAIKFIYDVYFELAIDDMLGLDSADKNVLFAEAIDIEKLAIIVAQARAITADVDRTGKVISGTKKKKVIDFIESLSLSAAQKHMILGYLGYKQSAGEEKVKAYVNRLKLTSAEKKALLEFSGYKVA